LPTANVGKDLGSEKVISIFREKMTGNSSKQLIISSFYL
jgi:hypothetical protein